MISIARKHGSCAKFCGSGGAIFGLSLDEKRKVCYEYYFMLMNGDPLPALVILYSVVWPWSFKKRDMCFVTYNHLTQRKSECILFFTLFLCDNNVNDSALCACIQWNPS